MLSNQFEISINPTIDMRKSLSKKQVDSAKKSGKKEDPLNVSHSSSDNKCRICWGSEEEMDLAGG